LQAHVRRQFFHNSIVLTEKSIEEHAMIIKFIREGDGGKVSSVMKENWLRAIEEFRSVNKE